MKRNVIVPHMALVPSIMWRLMFAGGIHFVLGSIPDGAGTMVLRCFLFSLGFCKKCPCDNCNGDVGTLKSGPS